MPRDMRLYLDDILEAIARVGEYVSGMSYQDFVGDRKTVDAVVRNLEIIGEAARSLPEGTRDLAPDIEWRKIVGLRNLLMHEYFGVNTAIVWDVVQNKLHMLQIACRRLLEEG